MNEEMFSKKEEAFAWTNLSHENCFKNILVVDDVENESSRIEKKNILDANTKKKFNRSFGP